MAVTLYADPRPWLRHVACLFVCLAHIHTTPARSPYLCTSAPTLLCILCARYACSLARSAMRPSLLCYGNGATEPVLGTYVTPRGFAATTLCATFINLSSSRSRRAPLVSGVPVHVVTSVLWLFGSREKAGSSRTAYRSSYQTVYLLVRPQLGDKAMSCSFRSIRAVHLEIVQHGRAWGTLSHPPEHAVACCH